MGHNATANINSPIIISLGPRQGEKSFIAIINNGSVY